MSINRQITSLALLLSISRAPLITGSSTSPNNPVFSGFQPDCQTCLDDAVQLCNDNNSFNDFCICTSTGTGYSVAFDTCPGICGRDDRNRGRVLLTQWADYCCALMPGEPTCTEYLRNPESFIPSALPTAGSGASSTASGSSSTTPASSKSEAFRSFRDRPAAALGSAISLVSWLIFL
ncbi:hypothetical protein QBC37DRAFT_402988 [Rhypophila decipiens]|uniref:Extracellular membrane protein CFEM domain-containing protein n=1 Tax=Rhypophila decipiens TaxID=261697 RepID=A0AAN6Y3X9_9PEZI|nr:hypothetical protein QBC37DRAFT_402988 [Rhypophila decipiens]